MAPTAPASASERIQLKVTQSSSSYPVRGRSGDEILSYIETYGPTDDSGQRASGITHYSSRLDWRSNGNQRSCGIDSMTIVVDLQVVLPGIEQLSSLPADVQTRWTAFTAEVASHEQRHVDIYLAGVQRIRDAMAALRPASGCPALEAQVNEIWESNQRTIDAEQERFHDEEKRRLESMRAPIRAQIDSTRAQLEGITAQIAGIDGSISSLTAEISAMRNLLNSLSSQLQAIEKRYEGQQLPTDAYQQYESLRRQYNGLIPAYNALIEQYNSLVDRRAGLVRQAEALQAQVNGLVDQFNWTR